MIREQSIWVILPNAGFGTRFGSSIPKQYISVKGKMIIEWTLDVFSKIDYLDGIIVANSKNDKYWDSVNYKGKIPLYVVEGGKERFDSVLNACEGVISHHGSENTWVLVHDVARPIISADSIHSLVEYCLNSQVAGILANKVTDTIKSVIDGKIVTTVDRTLLWQAQTPQFFPLGKLIYAMNEANRHGVQLTDESSAFEHCGYPVHVINSPKNNLKVTFPEDVDFIDFIKSANSE